MENEKKCTGCDEVITEATKCSCNPEVCSACCTCKADCECGCKK